MHRTGLADQIVTTLDTDETAKTLAQYMRLLFSATLLTSETVKLDLMDQWGNVKIPFLPETNSTTEE